MKKWENVKTTKTSIIYNPTLCIAIINSLSIWIVVYNSQNMLTVTKYFCFCGGACCPQKCWNMLLTRVSASFLWSAFRNLKELGEAQKGDLQNYYANTRYYYTTILFLRDSSSSVRWLIFHVSVASNVPSLGKFFRNRLI